MMKKTTQSTTVAKKKFSLNDSPLMNKLCGTESSKDGEMKPKEVLSYSVAGFGQNLICQLVTSFLLFFLTDAIHLSAIWLAWMFLGARLFDAFNDPIMGTIVDRTRSKYGKMRPYLKYMPIPIVAMTVLLFTTIPGNEVAKFAYATTIYLIWGICYTTVDVPYWGLASSMTSDTNKRNSMLTIARLFCTIGAGVVTVLLPAIQGMIETAAIKDVFANLNFNDIAGISKDAIKELPGMLDPVMRSMENGKDVWFVAPDVMTSIKSLYTSGYKTLYLVTACVIAVVALPTFYIGFKNTKERFYDSESSKASLGHNVKLLGKNKPIIMLILLGVLGSLRLIYMTSGLYYAKYNLGNTGLFSIMTILVVPGGLIATVTTPWLSKKFGKKNVFLFSHLIGGAAMLLAYFVGLKSNGSDTASVIVFMIVLVLLGVPSGYSNILQYSMIADSIDYLEDKTGERAEGICFSMQTFISKIGMAMTAFVTLMVLGVEGYSGEEIGATEGIKSGIWMMTTLLAGLSTLACCIPLFFYTFTEKKQAEAVARIAERKRLAAEAEALNAPCVDCAECNCGCADEKPVAKADEKPVAKADPKPKAQDKDKE
ncbi:MAG: MFS transporter [Clostridia bacterium]